jgi:poly-D-alanine transfer protein DltD
MTRVHFDLSPKTLITVMRAIRAEVDKVLESQGLESQGLEFSYGEGYAPSYEVGWQGWIKDEKPIHEVMKKWGVTDYNISTDHDEME